MRLVVADRDGVFRFRPSDLGREVFYVGDTAVVCDEEWKQLPRKEKKEEEKK